LAAHGAIIAALTIYVGSPRPSDEVVEIPVAIVAEIPQESPPPTPESPPPTPQTSPPVDQTPPLPPAIEEPPPSVEPPPSPPIEPRAPLPPVEASPPPKPEPPTAPKPAPRPQPKPQSKPAPARPALGGAASRPAAPKGDADAYRASLYARICGAVRYPEAARERGAEGVAVVSFSFDAAGQVTSAGLAQSSGDAALDADAVASVRRANPLPPPPEGAPRAYAVPIRYRLR
jgi:protein TonB